ncbi:hypothetical protein [Nostoc sp.]|uniref:hypothetical protein n=1 Tax=Nostoc sp. TaxID=1180 RepID=UPI002FFC3F1E
MLNRAVLVRAASRREVQPLVEKGVVVPLPYGTLRERGSKQATRSRREVWGIIYSPCLCFNVRSLSSL